MNNRQQKRNNNKKPVVVARKRKPNVFGVAKASMPSRMSKSNAYLSKTTTNRRELNDVPLGTSQRNGFNKNSGFKIVTKDEYIGEIAGTVAYNVIQYPVNPGQAITFPWLSVEALQWEKYEFLQLEFYLKPEVTQYTTNANSGKVILSFDSDASDAAPATKQAAEDTFPMCDGMPYQTESLVLPKFILNSHTDSFYVRPGNLPGGADIKTYDLGNLFISTMGQGTAFPNMMELRVRYSCKLMIPVLEAVKPAPRNYSVSQFYDSELLHAAGEYGVIFPPGTGIGIITTDGLGWTAVNRFGIFTPPAGNYFITVNSDCTASTSFGLQDLNLKYNTAIMEVNPSFQINLTGGLSSFAQCSLSQSLWLSFNGTTDTLQVTLSATTTSGGTWNSFCTMTVISV
jgi:hypothetical protein